MSRYSHLLEYDDYGEALEEAMSMLADQGIRIAELEQLAMYWEGRTGRAENVLRAMEELPARWLEGAGVSIGLDAAATELREIFKKHADGYCIPRKNPS